MTAQSWGVELWDQGENILKYTNDGISHLEMILKSMNDLAKLCTDTSKSHKRFLKAYIPKENKNQSKKETEDFTCVVAFNEILNSLLRIGLAYESMSESLKKDVITELKTLADECRKKYTKLRQDYEKLKNHMKDQRNVLENVIRKYRNAYLIMIRSHEAYQKADEDKTLSRLEIEKAKNIWEQKKEEYFRLRGDYAAALSKFNGFQRNYYTKSIPSWSTECELLDQERLKRLREILNNLARIEGDYGSTLGESVAQMQGNASSINAAENSRILVSQYRTNTFFPGDIAYVDLEETNGAPGDDLMSPGVGSAPDVSNQNTIKKSGKKSGWFGGGGGSKKTNRDNQSISQDELVRRYNDLQNELKQAKKELESLESLKNTYEKTPSLGDPSSIEPNIDAAKRRIASLNEQMQTYEKSINGSISKPFDDDEFDEFNDGDIPPPPSDSLSSDYRNSSVIGPNSSLPPAPVEDNPPVYLGSCTALYDFRDGGEGYLDMNGGDQFYILEGDINGWTKAITIDQTQVGLIPTNYLDIRYF